MQHQELNPHVHPFLVYPTGTVGVTAASLSTSTLGVDGVYGVVNIQTPHGATNINKYHVEDVDDNGNTVKEHILDLNLRTGFDATSTDALDTRNEDNPYLDPASFGYAAENWQINLIVPLSWVSSHNGYVNVAVHDTWGHFAGGTSLLAR
jgi:hypothetical protein